MRPHILKVKVGNSIVTIIDNGKNVVQTVRPFKKVISNEKYLY